MATKRVVKVSRATAAAARANIAAAKRLGRTPRPGMAKIAGAKPSANGRAGTPA